MDLREINDREIWEGFVLTLSPNTFLQSWEWGQVQKQQDDVSRYTGIFDDNKLVGVALVITVHARRGRHYLIPHGPIIAPNYQPGKILPILIQYLRTKAQAERVVALRIAPLLLQNSRHEKLFDDLGFRPAPLHVHAERTWVLDIGRQENVLLQQMRKTTRHAISRAERAGVTTEIVASDTAADRFWPLYEKTQHRHEFVPWSRAYISEQLKIFGATDRIFTVIAQFQGQDVAAAICPVYGQTAFYYHGASRLLPSSVPATQLVQWAAIREAKRRGLRWYNFWGIAPADKPKHPFAGITTFKTGFGGLAQNYLHAQDLPFTRGYWPLWAADSWRKMRRGF